MASRGRRIVSPGDRPENEAGAERDAAQLSEQEPLAAPPEGFAARPGEPEQGAPSADRAAEARAAAAIPQEIPSRGWEAVNEAVAGYACRSIDLAARSAIDMLGVKTWSEAVAVNAALARHGFEEWLDSSARISTAGVDLATESVRPVICGLGELWTALPKAVRPRR